MSGSDIKHFVFPAVNKPQYLFRRLLVVMDPGLIDVAVFQFHCAVRLIRMFFFPDEENNALATGNILDIAADTMLLLLSFGNDFVGEVRRCNQLPVVLIMLPLLQFLKILHDPAVMGFGSTLIRFLICCMMRLW